MSNWTNEEKELLVTLYPSKTNKELENILNKTSGQIRGMKERLHLNQKNIPFSEEEKEIIRDFYLNNPDEINLDKLSSLIHRPKTSIARYARKIGLTNQNRSRTEETVEKVKSGINAFMKSDKYLNEIYPKQKQLLIFYLNYHHPKGMLGKHHNKDTKERMSASHIELSKNMTYEEKHEIAMKAVETKRKNGGFNTTSNAYSRCHGGYREDLSHYFRSAWEANIARILNYYSILWEYECRRFDFEEEESEVLSYQPDFYLPQYDIWIEVKGWMDDKSKKRLELFEMYYPCEFKKLLLIDSQHYLYADKIYRPVIDLWEYEGHYLNCPRKKIPGQK